MQPCFYKSQERLTDASVGFFVHCQKKKTLILHAAGAHLGQVSKAWVWHFHIALLPVMQQQFKKEIKAEK